MDPEKPGHILNEMEKDITAAYDIRRIIRGDLERLNSLVEDGGSLPEDAARRTGKALEHLAEACGHLKGAARAIESARRSEAAASLASLHAALGNLPPGAEVVSLEDPAALHEQIGRAIGEA